MTMSEPVLFAEDIARLRKISRWQARRWLKIIEEEYGAAVVGQARGRRGVRRYTTESALARIGPRTGTAETRLLAIMSDLERRIRALEEENRRARPHGAHRST